MLVSKAQQTDRPLRKLEEKFFRLLEVDRSSDEFDALYREVDQELSFFMKEEKLWAS